MGVVYKAIDQREIENGGRDPHVAIKVLNEQFKRHPDSARALQRESKKAMRLAHPNIVLVRDFDRDRGNVYMVMELLYGKPLDELVREQYPNGMPLDKVIDIVSGLGAALSYAHQQGIVHADFKPSNAFLTNQSVAKVLDFGVARVARALNRGDSTLFDAGKFHAMSPAYASIEMLMDEAPDPRDDLYALGCVTYFLLRGHHPFGGIDAMRARDSALLPKPIDGLPDRQWQAIRSALIFERQDRTPSVRDFLSQFCIDSNKGAISIAGRANSLAGLAARKPWLAATPAGILLVAGFAFLMVHGLSKHPGLGPTAAAPPLLTQPKTVLPAENQGRPGIQQRDLLLGSIDSIAPEQKEVTPGAAPMAAEKTPPATRPAIAAKSPQPRLKKLEVTAGISEQGRAGAQPSGANQQPGNAAAIAPQTSTATRDPATIAAQASTVTQDPATIAAQPSTAAQDSSRTVGDDLAAAADAAVAIANTADTLYWWTGGARSGDSGAASSPGEPAGGKGGPQHARTTAPKQRSGGQGVAAGASGKTKTETRDDKADKDEKADRSERSGKK
jgi:serine/threonine protein kinase